MNQMIQIVTIGDIQPKLLRDLASKIEKTFLPFTEGCLLGASLEMPPAAYDAKRRQHDANLILERVFHRVPGENRVLALTTHDLYTSSVNFNFIFGQAQCPGRVALVSLYRLNPEFYGQSDDGIFFERATKEAIHELGHTFWLGHCPDPSCVMCFSNSILDVDRKKPVFCKTCQRKLYRRSRSTIHIWR